MSKKNNELTFNLIYNICYQILSLIVPLITAPYISRTLGKAGIGEYSYTYSIAHYFVLFIMLGVLNYGNREIAQVKDDKKLLDIMFSGIYSVQLFLGIGILLVYLFYAICIVDNYKAVALAQILYIISGILDISWFYFGIEKFKVTAGVSAINKIVTTILIFVFIKHENDVFIYTLILAGGALLNNLCYWLMLKKYISKIKITLDGFKNHLRPLIILFIPVIAVSIYKYMDKIMLGVMVNTSEVGIYESAEKFVNLPLCLITAIGTVMLPRISKLKEQTGEGVVKRYNAISMSLIMFLSFGMVFGLAGITTTFIPWFYGEEFANSSNVLILLLPSILFVSWANIVRTQCLLPNKRDKDYCVSVISGAFVNFTINFVLIPYLGAIGAAIGTTLAELIVCIIQTVETRNEMEFKKYALNSIPYLISAIIMYLIITNISFELDLITILIRIVTGIGVYLILSLKFIIKSIKSERVLFNEELYEE